MTDADALLAAALASPDDYSLRLIWLDALEEAGERLNFVRACREFLAKCGERRKYESRSEKLIDGLEVDNGLRATRRRALPGWREWLGEGDQWLRFHGHLKKWIGTTPFATGWMKLIPSIFSVTTSIDFWRRKGATVEVQRNRPDPHNPVRGDWQTYRARLTFARGFLERVEFRDWQSADALLSAILADQPFVECGIRGAVGDTRTFGTFIRELMCGPAFDLIEGEHSIVVVNHERHKFFGSGLDLADAAAFARAALSDALRKRALAGVAAPTLAPHLHPTYG